MTDANQTPSVADDALLPSLAPVPRRAGPLRRLGCGLALLLWLGVLLLPCLFFTLATQEQITVRTGSLPEQELRLWVQMDADNRGMVVSNGSVTRQTDTLLCIETTVNYLLWQGEEVPSQYCTCYERANAAGDWMPADGDSVTCAP